MKFFICVFSVFSWSLISQDLNKSYIGLPKDLTENANACFLESHFNVVYESRSKVLYEYKYVVTVFNKNGFESLNTQIYYKKSSKVTKAQAVMYDQLGKVVKKFKKSDFRDFSAVDGGSIISDARVLNLDITPTFYPFTLEFHYELASVNTAFMHTWNPIESMHTSVLKSHFVVEFPTDLGFHYIENNLDTYNVKKSVTANRLSYEISNVPALKHEYMQPSYRTFIPSVSFAVTKFHLEGVDGEADNWQDLGKWIDTHLLKDTDDLPAETLTHIKAIVGEEVDPLKKAALVYKFVQDHTRYISIQLGIGGWKPMLASDVDRLKYGDCKALTNYTQQLLKAVDVPSYYSIVYSGSQKRGFTEDLVALQGDHVFLAIPHQEEMYWLECTNHQSPFGYIGDFTDDREVLVITPEGGRIIKTTGLKHTDNYQHIAGTLKVDVSGSILADLVISSGGRNFSNKQRLEKLSSKDIEKHYLKFFNGLPNFKINQVAFENDFETITTKETLQLGCDAYVQKMGQDYIMRINAFNLGYAVPPRIRDRKLPFEITRGFIDTDIIDIVIPEGFVFTFLPEDVSLITDFGTYEIKIIQTDNGVSYKRSLALYAGVYDKVQYDQFRSFFDQIARYDNAKVILKEK